MAKDEQSQALVPVTPLGDREFDRFARAGTWLAALEGSKDPKGPEGMAAAYRIAVAADIGYSLRAASEISVIKGTPHISAKLLRALAERDGYRIVRKELTDDSCTAAVIDKATGEELGDATFTIADAERAGLIKRSGAEGPWTTYPQRMLWARASGWAVYDHIPHVALGLGLTEEAEDYIEGHVVEEPDEVESDVEVPDEPATERQEAKA